MTVKNTKIAIDVAYDITICIYSSGIIGDKIISTTNIPKIMPRTINGIFFHKFYSPFLIYKCRYIYLQLPSVFIL